MERRGYFIVVEGLEGAGKSTIIQIIKDYLNVFIPAVRVTREPGGTRLGEMVRQYIKEKIEDELIDPRSELLLMYAARMQLVQEVIKPALARGEWILSDRFELSTWAYQGGGRQLDKEMIMQLSKFCLNGLKPDLTIFLDIEPEQGLSRAKGRGAIDRIEQEPLSFFKAIYDEYHRQLPLLSNVIHLDASQSLEHVKDELLTQLKAFVEQHATV